MNILILGGGFGGLTVATRLGSLTPNGHTVTLIDKKDWFQMGLGKLWGLVGLRPPEEGRRLLTNLSAKGVRFVQSEVRRIDLATKTVMTREKIFSYDLLVVALGADTVPAAVPGLPETSNFYDPANIPALHQQLKSLREGRVAIVICKSPYKCPPAPYEAAMLVESFLRKRGLMEKVKIRVYVPEERPVMVAGKAAGEQVIQMIADRGMKVETEHKITKVDAPKKKLFFENGHEHEYDVLLAIPPHVAPSVVKDAGMTDESGWVPIDPATLTVLFPKPSPSMGEGKGEGGDGVEIFAIGDITSIKLPGGGMLPKAGVFAEAEGELVAEQILAKLGQPSSNRPFDGKGYCFFEAGDGKAMMMQGDFFGDPTKRVAINPPSEEAFLKKQQFERDRLARWFH